MAMLNHQMVFFLALILDQQHVLGGGLEHEFYDFPYIGNSTPN